MRDAIESVAPTAAVPFSSKPNVLGGLFMHKTWQTVHKASPDDAAKLFCGRMKNASHVKFALPLKNRILCVSCFGYAREL